MTKLILRNATLQQLKTQLEGRIKQSKEDT